MGTAQPHGASRVAAPAENNLRKVKSNPEVSLTDDVIHEVLKTKNSPEIPLSNVSTSENKTDLVIDEHLKNIFIPDWNNKPQEVEAVLKLGGTPILTFQNTSTIIALPGVGKSSICESIGASFLNPAADTLGFEVSKDCRGVLIIDNERTTNDVWNSFYRMCKRAGVPQGAEVRKVKIAGLRSIARAQERKKVIERLLCEDEYSLLLIDGIGDLVEDSNDLLQAIECRIWLREVTVKYKLSIITTVHPNPNSTKPRGHVGSEAYRESECALLAKKIDDNSRIITSDFEHGKNRNNSAITTAYQWSEMHNMFISADAEGLISNRSANKELVKKNQIELLALKIVPPLTSISRSALENQIRKVEDCSESTAKRKANDMISFGFIKKFDDGLYRSVA